MTQPATLQRLGSKVRVNIGQLRDRLSPELIQLLSVNPEGRIVDFKMTDGTGIGLVLELGDGTISWFFDDEIEVCMDEEKEMSAGLISSFDYSQERQIILEKPPVFVSENIIDVFNPIKFFGWLLYSLKDVV